MADCQHEPRCHRTYPDYCWPAGYVEGLVADCHAQALDPVAIAGTRGYGLGARAREHVAATGRPRIEIERPA